MDEAQLNGCTLNAVTADEDEQDAATTMMMMMKHLLKSSSPVGRSRTGILAHQSTVIALKIKRRRGKETMVTDTKLIEMK